MAHALSSWVLLARTTRSRYQALRTGCREQSFDALSKDLSFVYHSGSGKAVKNCRLGGSNELGGLWGLCRMA
jgi:hypothetical protein